MYLHTRRPSPTTVEFTVTNSPPRTTLSSHIFFVATIALRLIVGIVVAGLSYLRWAAYSPPTDATILAYLYSPIGNTLFRASASIPLSVFLPLLLVTTWVVIKRFHTSESLLVIQVL